MYCVVCDAADTASRVSCGNVTPKSPEHATLNELARHQPEEGFRGVLRRVSLPDVLQMECLSRSSTILEIATKELRGHIFIEQGQIVLAPAQVRSAPRSVAEQELLLGEVEGFARCFSERRR